MHLVENLILKKRNGVPLSADEISLFVTGICDETVSEAQIAAFTMATWFNGMSVDEQMALTLAMRDSGRVLAWPDLDGPVLDKHSTGGVGDMVSLILGPVIASCGAYVPMISGRGLGHTGGTLDKLESIPGFDMAPGLEQFQRWVRVNGVAIIGQTDELAPADRRIYAVRDVTATVSSTPLIVSSILSKKLAEGLDALVLDIKYGSGAFQAGPSEALELAGELTQVSCQSGLPCHSVITDMDQPLAWSAGNALEVTEAVRFLRGDARHERLLSVVLALCSDLLFLGDLADSAEQGSQMALSALDSGRAAEQFAVMVAGQGGPSGFLQDAGSFLPVADVIRPVYPKHSGYIEAIDTRLVGCVVVQLGGGRSGSGCTIDPAVGISDISGIGQWVGPDTPLAVVHAATEAAWELAALKLKSAIDIGQEQNEPLPVIHGRVEGGQTVRPGIKS